MEPIPSKPHASRRLFVSLIALVVVVMLGLFWHNYEHTKILNKNITPVQNAQDLDGEQKAILENELNTQSSATTYSDAQKAAIVKQSEKDVNNNSSQNLSEDQKNQLIQSFNSR